MATAKTSGRNCGITFTIGYQTTKKILTRGYRVHNIMGLMQSCSMDYNPHTKLVSITRPSTNKYIHWKLRANWIK